MTLLEQGSPAFKPLRVWRTLLITRFVPHMHFNPICDPWQDSTLLAPRFNGAESNVSSPLSKL
jgi:hypothetical protein